MLIKKQSEAICIALNMWKKMQ